jgi:hypothetical protein
LGGFRALSEKRTIRITDIMRITRNKVPDEEFNKHKMRALGLQHPDVKAFIKKQDNDCKCWNNYVKIVNQTMGAGLEYQRNRYTGRTPFD